MKRNKRRDALTEAEKEHYRIKAEQFKRDLLPLFTKLKAFGDGYKALHAISEVIDAAYPVLDIKKPDVR
jgi:hypothetical protein